MTHPEDCRALITSLEEKIQSLEAHRRELRGDLELKHTEIRQLLNRISILEDTVLARDSTLSSMTQRQHDLVERLEVAETAVRMTGDLLKTARAQLTEYPILVEGHAAAVKAKEAAFAEANGARGALTNLIAQIREAGGFDTSKSITDQVRELKERAWAASAE